MPRGRTAPIADVGETHITDPHPRKRRSIMGILEVSQGRIDANRRNAMRSTGPKTAEGKEKSRRNSLTHGLAGAGVVVAEAETKAAGVRIRDWNEALKPANAFEETLVETIVVESLRMERCRAEDALARDIHARKAEHCWVEGRLVAIEHEARTLSARPAATSNLLALSAPGCDWLIARWRMLGHALDTRGDWSADQVALALDLLGVAADLRAMPTPLDAPEGVHPLESRQALVDDQLERLLDRKERSLDPLEDELRDFTMQGLNVTNDPTIALIRRYETASYRRMRWALDLLARGKARADEPGTDHNDPKNSASQAPQGEPEPRTKRSHPGQPRLVEALKPAAENPAPVVQLRLEPTHKSSTSRRQDRKSRLEKNRRHFAEAMLLTC
jgi:hypothetical protein